MFQEPPERRSFNHNTQALMEKKYLYAGQLISHSLANGGPGFPCLSEAVGVTPAHILHAGQLIAHSPANRGPGFPCLSEAIGVTPAHILAFVTGCPVIPPMGLSKNQVY